MTFTPDTKLTIYSVVLAILAGTFGFVLRGCTHTCTVPPASVRVERDTIRYDADSIRAVIVAEMKAQPARIVTRTHVDTVIVADSAARATAEAVYAELDSVLTRHAELADLVATGYVKTDTYELSQIYSVPRREFGHVLTLFGADTVRTTACPEEKTFWAQVRDYALAGAVGAILGALLMGAR